MKRDLGGITCLRPSHQAAAPIPSTFLGRPTTGSNGIAQQYGSPYSTIGKASLISTCINEETNSELIESNDSLAHSVFSGHTNAGYQHKYDTIGVDSVAGPVVSKDCVSFDVIKQTTESYVICSEDREVRLLTLPELDGSRDNIEHISQDDVKEVSLPLPPSVLWDGDICESTDAHQKTSTTPSRTPDTRSAVMPKENSTGTILRSNKECKQLPIKRMYKMNSRNSTEQECMHDTSDDGLSNSRKRIIRDSNNPTCSNIEVVPKRKRRKLYPYPLFRNDDTGNLDNYLEDRRGSC